MISIRLKSQEEADELVNNIIGMTYEVTTGNNGESIYQFRWSGSANFSIKLSAKKESNEYFDQQGIKYKNIYKQ